MTHKWTWLFNKKLWNSVLHTFLCVMVHRSSVWNAPAVMWDNMWKLYYFEVFRISSIVLFTCVTLAFRDDPPLMLRITQCFLTFDEAHPKNFSYRFNYSYENPRTGTLTTISHIGRKWFWLGFPHHSCWGSKWYCLHCFSETGHLSRYRENLHYSDIYGNLLIL